MSPVPVADNLRLSAGRKAFPDRPEFIHDGFMRDTARIAADLLNAIDALHQPYLLPDDRTSEDCDECGDRWPCPTARLLHPAPKEDK